MSGGEKALKTGNDGENMMKGFLKAIGWENIATNETFTCLSGQKHKRKGQKENRENHNVDGVFHYDNPLNHEECDIVLCSSKHNLDQYDSKSKIYDHLNDLAYSLECAQLDDTFNNQFGILEKKKSYKGVLFWVTSNQSEQKESMITKVSDSLVDENESNNPRIKGSNYDSIYLVDNHKTTFIYSAIKTAENYRPNIKIKFLYPHTGFNNQSEQLMIAGEVMPIQYINTSLLPIVIEDDNKISVLIFCDSYFDSDSIKRLIWFAHKISGLTNEIIIYLNDYDKTKHFSKENIIKQSFKDNSLTTKISFKRTQVFDFVTLKEETQQNLNTTSSKIDKIKNISEGIEDDLDRILPYGEMIRPIIASTILSDSDIKAFLIRRGVYIGSMEKQNTVPLLSTLLLSPNELNDLKDMLRTKEDKVKSVPRSSEITDSNIDINKILTTLNTRLAATPPKNCTVVKPPQNSKNGDTIYIPYVLEKQNSTKDLITGKQQYEGSVSLRIENSKLNASIDYTSRETYQYGVKIFKEIEDRLLANGIIKEGFSTIKFNMFSNENRIKFFLNMMNMSNNTTFKNPELEHILIKPDSSLSTSLPFDLESLKGKVKDLSIRGEALDSIHYFKEDYIICLLMQKVKIKYEYEHGIEKGYCLVDLDFKNALSEGEDEAELHCNLEVLKTKNNKGKSVEKSRKELTKLYNTILQERHKNFITVQVLEEQPIPRSA